MASHILSLIVLTPAIGALLLAFVDRKNVSVIRQGALMISCANIWIHGSVAWACATCAISTAPWWCGIMEQTKAV